MNSPPKILIVEDEMIIGANISLQLSKLGYDVTGLVSKGEDAITNVRQNRPDIVLMDIQLKGEIDAYKQSIKFIRKRIYLLFILLQILMKITLIEQNRRILMHLFPNHLKNVIFNMP